MRRGSGGARPPWREARPGTWGSPSRACAVLAAYNNVIGVHPWHDRWYVRLNLVRHRRRAGRRRAERPDARGPRPRARPVAAGAARVPAGGHGGRGLAAHRRGAGDPPAARRQADSVRSTAARSAYQALIRIPVGTALWEEIAFRGVLQAALRRVMPEDRGHRGDQLRVRRLAHPPHPPGAAGQRAGRRPRPGRGRGDRGRRRDDRGRRAVLLAAGALRQPDRPILLHVATNSGGLVTALAVAAASPAARQGLPGSGRRGGDQPTRA